MSSGTFCVYNCEGVVFLHPTISQAISTSGNNVYIVWTSNDNGHWSVFFAKSTGVRKTFKTSMLSVPIASGHVVNQNAEITSQGAPCLSHGGRIRQGRSNLYLGQALTREIHLKKIRLNSSSAPSTKWFLKRRLPKQSQRENKLKVPAKTKKINL